MTNDADRESRDLTVDELKYGPDGLLVTVVQDADSGEVLMVAYMNPESVARTVRDRRTWFYSRSRNRYWMKGEESGNVQDVVSLAYDCDADALLVKVHQRGEGVACHTGARSCFYRELSLGDAAASPDADASDAAVVGVDVSGADSSTQKGD